MNPNEFFIWVTIGIGISLFCLYKAYRSFHYKRLIEDMPTSKIRSASQGYTELIGIAKPINQLQSAPLSGEPCVWWRYKVERYQRTRKTRFWMDIDSGVSNDPFYLDDNTGHCLIDPDGSSVTSKHVNTWYGNTRRPVLKPLHYDGRRVVMTTVMSKVSIGHKYRYTEHQIREGDPLYAMGHFETDAKGIRHISIAELEGDILRRWKLDFPKLLGRFDHNGDNQLDMEEWQKARIAATKEARKELRDLTLKPETHSLTKPNASGLPFIIGNQNQSALITQFQRKTLFFAAGFLILGAWVSWAVASRF